MITRLLLDRLGRRLRAQHIEVEFSEDAVKLLAKEGYDPEFGARPLRRTIQRLILDPLAQKVLSGEFKEGDTVVVDVENGKVVFWSQQYAAEKAEEREKHPVGAAKMN